MYFSYLREDLRNELTKINPIFSKIQPWKRSHYLIMADIITEHLQQRLSVDRRNEIGATISHATLRRFFENYHDEEKLLDLRFLKSVDKLAIFLGFENFTEFSRVKSSNIEKDSVAEMSHSKDDILNLVRKSILAEFQVYQSLPNPDFQILNTYFFEECPIRARLTEFISNLAAKNLYLVQLGKRSNVEILNIRLVSEEEGKIIVEAEEFWNVLFESRDNGEHYFFRHKNLQTYILLQEDGIWRIWDNYNPDAESIKRRTELGL